MKFGVKNLDSGGTP